MESDQSIAFVLHELHDLPFQTSALLGELVILHAHNCCHLLKSLLEDLLHEILCLLHVLYLHLLIGYLLGQFLFFRLPGRFFEAHSGITVPELVSIYCLVDLTDVFLLVRVLFLLKNIPQVFKGIDFSITLTIF